MLKHRLLGLTPRSFQFGKSGWSLELVFLTQSQVMLILLVQGLHLEKRCSRESSSPFVPQPFLFYVIKIVVALEPHESLPVLRPHTGKHQSSRVRKDSKMLSLPHKVLAATQRPRPVQTLVGILDLSCCHEKGLVLTARNAHVSARPFPPRITNGFQL